jgi:drug/metabolite transporter (DMT)-like permease
LHDSTIERTGRLERPPRAAGLPHTVAAFAAIYIVWGSTYLAIRVAVETLPALFAAGIRFAIAGVALYAWSRLRGVPAPTRREWRNLWILGALMFLAAYSGLFWAEKTLPSGIASVLVATIPVWTALLGIVILRTERFHWRIAVAVLMGLGGVTIIAVSQDALSKNLNLLACLALLGAQISWSAGSVISKVMALPKSKAISAGAQMMCGGVLILICALFAGELTPPPHISTAAALATAYLIVAGSIAAFTAYTWLLGRMPATTVASYAYVNPVIALAIGYWFGGEAIHASTILGSSLVLASVVLILTGSSQETGH